MGADRDREGRKSVSCGVVGVDVVDPDVAFADRPLSSPKLHASLCRECAAVGVGTRWLMATRKRVGGTRHHAWPQWFVW